MPKASKPKDLAGKVKKSYKTKQTGKRKDGLPKKHQTVRKGGRKYGRLEDDTKLSAGWIVDNPLPPPPPQESRFPENHPLWLKFKAWVETGTLVRRDLLNFHPLSKSGNDWKQIWLVFLAGALHGSKAMTSGE